MEASSVKDKRILDFRKSLKTKILLDRLVKELRVELSSHANGFDRERTQKLKEWLRELLAHTEFEMRKERTLELYVATGPDGSQEILVLGRELPLYHGTTMEDVAMRKDPLIEEMVRLRNIKKILVDKDILFTRGTNTVDVLYQRGISLLNLEFTPEDIFGIRDEGLAALHRGDADGVLEMLELLFELTGYTKVASGFVKKGYKIYGKPKGETERAGFSNLIMVDEMDGQLKAIMGDFIRTSIAASELFGQVAKGAQEPDMADADVFEFLVKEVLSKKQGNLS
ncbi:MAG: hypothetical protein ABIF87_15890 [Pseudomonadota bacterium]